MPRTAEANQLIREAQRENILEAAMLVFSRRGIAATMDEIAAEAGVSHGLAYRHFSSKELLFQALIERTIQQSRRLDDVMALPGTPGERLFALVTAMIESRRQPEMFQLLVQILSDDGTPDSLRELAQSRFDELRRALWQQIVAAQASGEVVAGDPDQLVRAVFSALDGVIRWVLYEPGSYAAHFPDPAIFLRMLKP